MADCERKLVAETEVKAKKSKRYFLIIFSALILGLVFLLAIGFLLSDKAFSQKFYPRVAIEGINLYGLNQNQAFPLIRAKAQELSNKKLTINVNAEKNQDYSYADLGVNYNTDIAIENAWQIGHFLNFRSKFEFAKALVTGININFEPSFNSDKLTNSINDLQGKVGNPPQDAAITIDNGQAQIVAGKEGQKIDILSLNSRIKKAILARTDKIVVTSESEKPKIVAEDLASAMIQTQTWLNQNLNLSYGDNYFTAKAAEIGQWIKFNIDGTKVTADLDSDKINEYLNGIAKKINVAANDRVINGLNGQVIDDGNDGQTLNTKDAAKKITDALRGGGQTDITLTVDAITRGEKTVYDGVTAGLYPGKYIEVDLKNQALYQIEGSNIIGQYTVSTGKWSMPTPTGTFSINNKDPRAYSPTYGLYMPFWMSFIGSEYGIHALPEWPSGYKEGEAHLGIPVSHGCIRLSDANAEIMYNWAEIGTPVVVF